MAPRRSVLEVVGTDGETGYGECILEGSAEVIEHILMGLMPQIIGRSIWDSEHIEQMVRGLTYYPPGMLGLSALSALDQALWDLRGRVLQMPAWQLLGGRVRDAVPLYFHAQSGDAFPSDVASLDACVGRAVECVAGAVASGVRLVKTAAFGPVQGLATRRELLLQRDFLLGLVEGLGPDVDLAFDVHGRYSLPGALQLMEALQDVPLAFIEEPLHPHDRSALCRVVSSSPSVVATGERLGELWEFEHALEAGVGVLQPDLAHCGGISGGLRIATLARSCGAQVALHNPLGVVNLMASLQLGVALPNMLAQETVDLGERHLDAPLVVSDGAVPVDQLTSPGLGVRFSTDVLTSGDESAASWRTPTWADRDGAPRSW